MYNRYILFLSIFMYIFKQWKYLGEYTSIEEEKFSFPF